MQAQQHLLPLQQPLQHLLQQPLPPPLQVLFFFSCGLRTCLGFANSNPVVCCCSVLNSFICGSGPTLNRVSLQQVSEQAQASELLLGLCVSLPQIFWGNAFKARKIDCDDVAACHPGFLGYGNLILQGRSH